LSKLPVRRTPVLLKATARTILSCSRAVPSVSCWDLFEEDCHEQRMMFKGFFSGPPVLGNEPPHGENRI